MSLSKSVACVELEVSGCEWDGGAGGGNGCHLMVVMVVVVDSSVGDSGCAVWWWTLHSCENASVSAVAVHTAVGAASVRMTSICVFEHQGAVLIGVCWCVVTRVSLSKCCVRGVGGSGCECDGNGGGRRRWWWW